MKWNIRILLIAIYLFGGVFAGLAQEEESAELYLEEYTDEFQELFFEALKQKGIENYDKSINLLLECKQLETDNSVIDHELALVYLAEKEHVSALEYSILSLASQPENYWYLNTLVEILQAQGRTAAAIRERIPYQNKVFKENLALIYYKRRNYSEALRTLKELDVSSFTNDLVSKIKDSIDQAGKTSTAKKSETTQLAKDPLAGYKKQFRELLAQKDYIKLEQVAAESLESFPSQPYFYYMLGKALALNNKNTEATRVLESALDFLLDDVGLSNDIYGELANAYKALGNLTKANMYLSKIKNGS
ncbi:MAG: tetratricopeptide repeat protein [Flavobacteriaceae bacterium]